MLLWLICPVLIWFLPVEAAVMNEVVIALSSTPNNLSPLMATDANSQNLNRLTHLSLVDVDEQMNFVCRACQSYTQERTDSGHTIRFTLKSGLTFHDGQPIKSEDVKRAWGLYIDEAKGSVFRHAFNNIKQIQLVNDDVFEIQYETYKEENLSNLVLLKLIKEVDGKIIGAGPYQMVSNDPLEIKLKVRENHFEVKASSPNLTFKVVRDETTLALKLLKKEIDLSLAQISARKEDWLLKSSRAQGLKLFRTGGSNYIYLGINHQNPFLQDVVVRQAIKAYIPIDLILNYKLKNTAVPATGMFSRAFERLYLEASKGIGPEQADELLLQNGFKKNERGIWSKSGTELKFDWKVTNNRSTQELVEVIRHYWKKFGVDVTVTTQEWGTFSRSVRQRNFDIILGQWVGFTGPEMLGFVFHSEMTPPAGANRGGYQSPQFDRLFDLATSLTSEKEAYLKYREAHQLAMDDVAYISLWHPDVRWVGKDCISVTRLFPTGSFLALLDLHNNCKG